MSDYRIGIELELLTPASATRLDLAQGIAQACRGKVKPSWHLDSEPSAHDDFEVFHHLTPAFDVMDHADAPVARIVDDVTIHADLDRDIPALSGWLKVLSNDARLLRMLATVLQPVADEPLAESMSSIAGLVAPLGLDVESNGDLLRLFDSSGASVALVAEIRGEKQRVAECISPPLTTDTGGITRDAWLELVTGCAADLGCSVPQESATHIHYDAELFRQPAAFQRLVWAFGEDQETIREQFGTNPHCRRLGALPAALVEMVNADDYPSIEWDEIAERARSVDGVIKFADVNLAHLIAEKPKLDTVEFRMLPGSMDLIALESMVGRVDRLVDHFLSQ